jgi:hypothetical protein
MAPSDTIIQPQLLTAAALTWQLLAHAESRPKFSSDFVDDDEMPDMDTAPQSRSIKITPEKKTRPSVAPHLIAASYCSCDSSSYGSLSPQPVKPRIKLHESSKRIFPVVIPESPTADSSSPQTPRVPRVSAATMRNLQSRQRVQASMETYRRKNISSETQQKPVQESPSIFQQQQQCPPPVVIRESPSVALQSSPISELDCEELIRFKVKSNKNTIIRFQCEPSFETVKKNIVNRIGASSRLIIKYKDVDGDMCTLTNDDDLQDAIAAADVMVRLEVEEETKSFFQTISSIKLTW